MKTITASWILIVLLAGCASQPNPMPPSPPRAQLSNSENLLLISAVYGSGISFSDVTTRVDDLLHQPNIEFFARPEWLHADPTPGWNKALVIEYEYRGQRHIFTAGEGGKVSTEELISHATPMTPKHRTHRKKH